MVTVRGVSDKGVDFKIKIKMQVHVYVTLTCQDMWALCHNTQNWVEFRKLLEEIRI